MARINFFTRPSPVRLPPAELGQRSALDRVRAELLAIPPEAVEMPYADPGELRAAAAGFVAATRRENSVPEEAIRRIDLLAEALEDAQKRYCFKSMPEKADAGLMCYVDRMLCRMEAAAAQLVASGALDAAELPRALGSGEQHRLTRGIALAALLGERKVRLERISLPKMARLCARLRPWMEESPAQLLISELRDRAYTALRTELDAARQHAPRSGVHVVAASPADAPTTLSA